MSQIFGSVAQNGYVVRDIEKSMERWRAAGVGPWAYFCQRESVHFPQRGPPSGMELSGAIANSGDLQLELIQQRNDAPSMYREFLDAGHEGMQHMSYWTDDYQGLYDKALSHGFEVGHEGCIGGEQGRFAYFDTQWEPGTVIEISDVSGPKGMFFQHVREVAADWDGTEPIRRLS